MNCLHTLFDFLGMCRAFDDAADGYVRGEGCAAVVVRRLEDAIRDGEHIYCIVRGTAANACGAGPSITMPSSDRQREVIQAAYKNAGVKPSESLYVELHGTGTPVGDPIELKGAGLVFSEGRSMETPIRIGSVKSSIGHLENAAGIASVVKVALMLDRNVFLPTRNHTKPNHKVDWANFAMKVQTETEPMPALTEDNPFNIASVSSYGFGGANCHAVFQSPPRLTGVSKKIEKEEIATVSSSPLLFCMGGSSKDAVQRLCEKWSAAHGSVDPYVASVILARRVRSYQWRSFAVGDSLSNLKWCAPKFVEGGNSPIVMVFSGQGKFALVLMLPSHICLLTYFYERIGPQHFNMGRDLYKTYQAFRDSVDHTDSIYTSTSSGESIKKTLGLFDGPFVDPVPKGSLSKVRDTVIAIVTCQLALYDLYKSMNVIPDIVMGHSLGEIAMQYASGVLSKEGAVRLMAARATAMSLADGSGTMMALGTNEAAALRLISGIPDLWVAAINSPSAVTVAGSVDAIATLEARIAEQAPNLFARKLRVTNAYHTPLMMVSQDAFFDLLEKGNVFGEPQDHLPQSGMKVVSTVTGKFMTSGFGAQYCWSNVIEAVRFEEAIKTVLSAHPNALFVEMANHPVLGKSIEQCGAERSSIFCGMHRENPAESKFLLTSLGNLVMAGARCIAFDKMPESAVTHLPKYPYMKKKHWSEVRMRDTQMYYIK
jgi:acyl transferase domain-containing protein